MADGTPTVEAVDKLLPLCRVEDLPKHSTMSTEDIAWCETHIRLFSRLAESEMGRSLRFIERTRDFSIRPFQRVVRLPAYGHPESAVTSVWSTLSGVYDATTLVDPATYIFDTDTGVLERRFTDWLAGVFALRVAWTGGMAVDATQVPEDLKGAAIMQVASWYQRRDQLNVNSMSLGGESTSRFSEVDLLPLTKRVLASYSY